MDIKRKYFDVLEAKINEVYDTEHEDIAKMAGIFCECMTNGGVVQIYGTKHYEEFVNELFFRAGGISPLHGYRFKDLILHGVVKQEDIDSGAIYNDLSVVDKFEALYQLDPRDMYIIVSYSGDEPLAIELAKRAKQKGQRVVAIVNKKTYDKTNSTLLDYCEMYLDTMADDPDNALDLDGTPICQISSATISVMAQLLTAEMYKWYVDHNLEAPVLLSANIKGADVHNNSLTDPYERRIR